MPEPQPLDHDLPPKCLQEEEVTQEFNDLISTLPTEKGWVTNPLHQYQSFWHSTRQMQGVLACQKQFQAHDSDILLVTSPKSGTTWLKALTFSILNRNTHRLGTIQNHPLLTTSPHDLVPFLELNLYLQKQVDLTSFPSPRLFSSHLPYVSLPESVKKTSCKIVYLCRNPKDVFVSLWHFTNRQRPGSKGSHSIEDAFEKFCRGVSLYGPFWDHVLGYRKECSEKRDKVMFLRFEKLKEKRGIILKELAEFMGCPFSKEEEDKGVVDDILNLCSFENLSNLEVNKSGKLSSGEENKASFRCGEVGDWKSFLTPERIQKLKTITEEKLGKHWLSS